MIGLLAVVAGGLGAAARFVVDGSVSAHLARRSSEGLSGRLSRSGLPWATTLINVTGSFALGVVVGLVTFHGAPGAVALVVGTGFLGGYTTFSTASYETVRLAQRGRWGAAAAHTAVMVLGTLGAAALGLAVTAAW